MKLKNPGAIKEELLKKLEMATHRDIATGLKMSSHTVAKLLDGEPVRPATIKKVAAALGTNVGQIAVFVEN